MSYDFFEAAKAFLAFLNAEGPKGIRLLSVAEWDYARRGLQLVCLPKIGIGLDLLGLVGLKG